MWLWLYKEVYNYIVSITIILLYQLLFCSIIPTFCSLCKKFFILNNNCIFACMQTDAISEWLIILLTFDALCAARVTLVVPCVYVHMS